MCILQACHAHHVSRQALSLIFILHIQGLPLSCSASTMHFTALALSIALALAPAGVFGWAKAADGVWVANNVVYPQVGNCKYSHWSPESWKTSWRRYTNGIWHSLDKNVHESCTRMNSNIVLTSGGCAYWVNGQGEIKRGRTFAVELASSRRASLGHRL